MNYDGKQWSSPFTGNKIKGVNLQTNNSTKNQIKKVTSLTKQPNYLNKSSFVQTSYHYHKPKWDLFHGYLPPDGGDINLLRQPSMISKLINNKYNSTHHRIEEESDSQIDEYSSRQMKIDNSTDLP